jgi:hypothetical protein
MAQPPTTRGRLPFRNSRLKTRIMAYSSPIPRFGSNAYCQVTLVGLVSAEALSAGIVNYPEGGTWKTIATAKEIN